jgi:hypothetical protein
MAAAVLSGACAPARAGDERTPVAVYEQALAVMGALPQSSYAHFTTSVRTDGFGVAVHEDGGVASLAVGFGRSYARTASWPVALRSADGKAVLRDERGASVAVGSSLFKPTWRGAYQWARYGFGHAAPTPPASATALPDDNAQTVIGRSIAVAPGAYRIEDGPPAACPDGTPGRHLHLTAIVTPETHPLTDVVIDDRANRICTMRFNLVRGGAFSLTGVFDLDFGDREGYWVVVDGSARVIFRVFGIGAKHASMTFTYTGFAFSAQPPDPLLAS